MEAPSAKHRLNSARGKLTERISREQAPAPEVAFGDRPLPKDKAHCKDIRKVSMSFVSSAGDEATAEMRFECGA